jgi:hypothetical protein
MHGLESGGMCMRQFLSSIWLTGTWGDYIEPWRGATTEENHRVQFLKYAEHMILSLNYIASVW